MKTRTILKFLVLILAVVAGIAAYRYNVTDYLTLENIKSQQGNFILFYQNFPLETIAIFATVYILVAALSIPGATILTLLGGAIFDLGLGLLIVSFCSVIGASLAFLVARFLMRDPIEKRFHTTIAKINAGIEKEGAMYLFTLRLVPLFPFFIVNLVSSVTKLPLITFFWVSQLGMLPGTAVYVNAGKQLANINSPGDILSAPLILSFVLMGTFPFVIKGILRFFKTAKVYRPYRARRPKKYDYNLIVIGAGSAGLVASYIAAAAKAKVALIEKDKMGGDCLNTGCVPSKALIKAASMAHTIQKAQKYGILSASNVQINFAKAMKHVHNSIHSVEPHDSIERYESLGVTCIKGSARIVSPWEVKVNNKILTTRSIIISTGAAPFVPPLKNIAKVKYLTSDTVWNLKTLPKKLVILGGGPIGSELALAFARLGSQVTQIEVNKTIMKVEDPPIGEFFQKKFLSEGIKILNNHRALGFEVNQSAKFLIASHQDKEVKIPFDEIIISIGRRPNTKGFGAEELGITLRKNGTIDANEFLQTNFPNIYVCGDITGPFQFTHTAGFQASYAAFNALYGMFHKSKVDYTVVPWCTYTDPEVASVGLNETRAKAQGIEYDLTTYNIADLDRAITDMADEGFVRVLTRKGTDKIIGATIVSASASTMILEFISAMKHKAGLKSILSTIHIYPSMGEANKNAAGEWRKRSISDRLLKISQRIHRFMRS